jgi:uncharacterized glyoxalase superfamily protein PhnB
MMATTTETRLQATSISPTLTVDDLQKSIAFFEGLGFGIEERWEENGVLLGVSLRAGEALVNISQDDGKKGRRQKGQGMRIFIATKQNIDQVAADAKKNGITLDKEPYDAPWGARTFDVTEPSGFLLTIASE